MQSDKEKKAQAYLKKYGYIDPFGAPSGTANDLYYPVKAGAKKNAKGETSSAVRRFQKFAGLPATGRLNQPTLKQMEKPRCGFPDITTNQLMSLSLNAVKWNNFNISYAIQDFTDQFTLAPVRQAIRTAFNVWTSAAPFQFQEVLLTHSPKIVIRFVKDSHGDPYDFDGAEGELAHAFPPNPSLGAIAGDIHFDDDEIWSLTVPTTDKDLVSVAAHEIGHSLGLGHSEVRESLMYAIYEGEHRFLHDDDVTNIRDLYGV